MNEWEEKRREEISNLIYGCPIDCLNPSQIKNVNGILSQGKEMIREFANKIKSEHPLNHYTNDFINKLLSKYKIEEI